MQAATRDFDRARRCGQATVPSVAAPQARAPRVSVAQASVTRARALMLATLASLSLVLAACQTAAPVPVQVRTSPGAPSQPPAPAAGQAGPPLPSEGAGTGGTTAAPLPGTSPVGPSGRPLRTEPYGLKRGYGEPARQPMPQPGGAAPIFGAVPSGGGAGSSVAAGSAAPSAGQGAAAGAAAAGSGQPAAEGGAGAGMGAGVAEAPPIAAPTVLPPASGLEQRPPVSLTGQTGGGAAGAGAAGAGATGAGVAGAAAPGAGAGAGQPGGGAPAAGQPPGVVATAPASRAAGSGSLDGIRFGWPLKGTVLQDFSQTTSRGLSIGSRPKSSVVAAADGKVIFSGAGPREYGNLIIVKHGNDLLTVYANNSSLAVKEGQDVRRGQKIAEAGGAANRPQLHFEIRQQGKPIDPLTILPAQ